MQRAAFHRLRFVAGLTLALAFSGCAHLDFSPIDFTAMDKSKEVAPSPTTHCSVEFRDSSGKSTVRHVAVDPNSTINDVLKASKASKEFNKMDVELMRRLPNGGAHKMTAKFNNRAKRVDVLNDYAVQPGDQLVVTENTAGLLDEMLGDAVGPLAKQFSLR